MWNDQLSVQQFRDGVVLRMCCGLILPCFVRFFDNFSNVATIPACKSRFEFLNSFFICELAIHVFRYVELHWNILELLWDLLNVLELLWDLLWDLLEYTGVTVGFTGIYWSYSGIYWNILELLWDLLEYTVIVGFTVFPDSQAASSTRPVCLGRQVRPSPNVVSLS